MRNGSLGVAADLSERLSGAGHVETKRMFGGISVILDGVHFGMIMHDTVYFRVDDEMRGELVAKGMTPFGYAHKNGKPVTVASYYSVPDETIDDEDALTALAKRSQAVAAMVAAKKKPAVSRKRSAT